MSTGMYTSIVVTYVIVITSDTWSNFCMCFFFQAEAGIRDLVRSRGLGDVYKRQRYNAPTDEGHPAPQGRSAGRL